MLKKILFTTVLCMFMTVVVAVATPTALDKKTVSSKAYVDTQVATKQIKIPAAGQAGVGAGETVMTYTANGNGEIGERGLYSDTSSYNAAADGDKLITASALNATFTNLPTTDTTKLECANESDGCTLWAIVDQTAFYTGLVTLDPTRYYAYISTDSYWSYSNDSYSVVIPVIVGHTYKIVVPTTTPLNGSQNVIFRYGFVNEVNETWKQGNLQAQPGNRIYDWVRTTPQDTPSAEVTATHPYMIIQMGAAAFSNILSNGYLTVADLGVN